MLRRLPAPRMLSIGLKDHSQKLRPNMTHITLADAAQKYPVSGLDRSQLKNQDLAFCACMRFLRDVKPKKSQNRRRSHGLKQIVENPCGHYGIPCSSQFFTCYIYEGTFILAALASGFNMKKCRRRGYLDVTFNISERSLRWRTYDWANGY
jgi:hypothetical protein